MEKLNETIEREQVRKKIEYLKAYFKNTLMNPVKAIEKEINGQKGYPEYIDWWQHAFAFNQAEPDYYKVVDDSYLLNRVCTDEEVDYIFSLFLRQLATPSVMPAQDLELSKAKRPELDYIQSLFEGRLGIPKMVVAKSLELIEKERPDLYLKLKKAVEDLDRMAVKGWG